MDELDWTAGYCSGGERSRLPARNVLELHKSGDLRREKEKIVFVDGDLFLKVVQHRVSPSISHSVPNLLGKSLPYMSSRQ